jgi:hypothetical protein
LVESEGYILRIATEKWVNQVFGMAIYYTSLRRRWKPGQRIVFLHKTSVGDSIIGYGVIGRVSEKDELSEEERRECEKHGWKKAIEFKYVKPVKPLPIKETFLKNSKLRGRYFHGLKLDEEQLNSIISQAERLQHWQ